MAGDVELPSGGRKRNELNLDSFVTRQTHKAASCSELISPQVISPHVRIAMKPQDQNQVGPGFSQPRDHRASAHFTVITLKVPDGSSSRAHAVILCTAFVQTAWCPASPQRSPPRPVRSMTMPHSLSHFRPSGPRT